MINRLFFILVCFVLVDARASSDYEASKTYSNNNSPYYSDPQKACNYGATGSSTNSGVNPTASYNAGTNQCIWTYTDGSSSALPVVIKYTCPYGGTLDAATHMCIGGDPPPPPPPSCPAETGPSITMNLGWLTGPQPGSAYAKQIYPSTSDIYKSSFCVNHCVVQPDAAAFVASTSAGVYVEQTKDTNGFYREFMQGMPTNQVGGDACDPDSSTDPNRPDLEPPAPSQAPAPGACPVGSTPSGQDQYGMTICVGTAQPSPTSSSTDTKQPTTTTQNADGSTTATDVSTHTNSDGSVTTTTTTTTTAADGTKTVVVNSTTGNSSSGSQGQQDKPDQQNDLCKLHPELTVCRNSQVIGSCGQITCTGDAIQCATLRAAAAMRCQQEEDAKSLDPANNSNTQLGQSILAGADPQQGAIDDVMKGSEVDMSNPNLDQSGFVSGVCLSPKTFEVVGHPVTVDFAVLCEKITPLRQVIMACAFIIAYLIVARSITQTS